jgi:hypothetical protein
MDAQASVDQARAKLHSAAGGRSLPGANGRRRTRSWQREMRTPSKGMSSIAHHLIFIVLLAAVAPVDAAGRAPSLCSDNETIVMSCRAGSKLASVCSLQAASGELLYAQYRFGRPGSPEIAIPPKSPFEVSLLRGETTLGAHGGWEGLSVRNGDVVYTLEHTWDQGLDVDDITVSRGGKRLKKFSCQPAYPTDGPDTSDLAGFITSNHLQALGPDTPPR